MPHRVGDREKMGPFPTDGAAPLHRRSHSRRAEVREVLAHPRRRGKAPGRLTCPKAGGDRGRRCSGPHRPHAPDEHPLPAGNVRGRGTGHGGRPPAGHRLGGILLLHRPAGQSGAGGGGVCGGHLFRAAPPAAAQVSALRQGVPAPAAPGLGAFALYVQAVIFAGSIGDSDDTADWSGVIFQGDSGQVYGDVTLEEDLTIDAGESLTIPQNATLTIKQGGTLTGGGTETLTATVLPEGAGNRAVIILPSPRWTQTAASPLLPRAPPPSPSPRRTAATPPPAP